ncbi:MAG TPA: PAS domain S-box protein [Mycobacteriales bacterium]|nr:PAS domain S-box protein [Mycobacteriales bacterium]
MSATPLECILELPPEPGSAAAARRAVRALVRECGHEQWLEAAELAVTELVTNGLLHAHTPLTLRAACGAELRVEIADSSPAMPVQRAYGEQATTGRGMGLVAAVTSDHGITPLPDGGKAVWFIISDTGALGDFGEVGGWSEVIAEMTAPAPGSKQVRLLGLPATLWLAAEQRHDALLRELALIRAARGADNDDLTAADVARTSVSTAVGHALAVARAEGRARNPLPANHPSQLEEVAPTLDVDLVAAADDAAMFAVLQDVLDEAERLAASEQMLSRPGLPEVIALRDWACEQIIAQLNGQSPSPWPGADAERFLSERDESTIDWDTTQISESDQGYVAADESNRIIAISRPLAELLGWEPEDLVGRRVVAIVPPQFREAHVAGFTRHLTTGQAHALGVDLELPVLRADSTEVVCTFFIEAHRTPSGRAVYVSRITPTDA